MNWNVWKRKSELLISSKKQLLSSFNNLLKLELLNVKGFKFKREEAPPLHYSLTNFFHLIPFSGFARRVLIFSLCFLPTNGRIRIVFFFFLYIWIESTMGKLFLILFLFFAFANFSGSLHNVKSPPTTLHLN